MTVSSITDDAFVTAASHSTPSTLISLKFAQAVIGFPAATLRHLITRGHQCLLHRWCGATTTSW